MQDDLLYGEEVAKCPSCSLRIRVIYDLDVIAAKHAPWESGPNVEGNFIY